MWDLIVSVPDHCLSFYFESTAYLKLWQYLDFCYNVFTRML